ncbi:response regulator [Halalkalibacter nanhaiisediminis]|uniref:Two-component system, CitB family, response regulator CitT n=1 Tax=Halalkalibacter nanhaiisediminis TaxID=688079 RepID=A0A562QB59_9BACI|nr:response regulator [Halalkalibacter nanhaiisediminis]TWI53991.1 two-component system, CitB family, response regulator CitT [Halalkalibacter nanhaiisediminis]
MGNVFHVLIVEDDFRVAEINRQFVEKIDGFTVLAIAKTGKEALAYLENSDLLPDLILLDVYIPDVFGLDLFWKIRKTYHDIDMIMITAAKEVVTIEEALRGGIFDYIVKPVDFTRFEHTLKRYRDQRILLSSKSEMEQEEIDLLTGLKELHPLKTVSNEVVPKGIDRITLDKIEDILKQSDGGMTAVELGAEIGVSRSTARRYLEYLVSIHKVEANLKYGDVGRPERRYVYL